jgi:hypothetical protein
MTYVWCGLIIFGSIASMVLFQQGWFLDAVFGGGGEAPLHRLAWTAVKYIAIAAVAACVLWIVYDEIWGDPGPACNPAVDLGCDEPLSPPWPQEAVP